MKQKRKPKPAYIEIGARIRAARKARELSQLDIARACGITDKAVQQWESGRTAPRGTRLQKLSTTIRHPIQWILDGPKVTDSSVLEAAAQYSLGPTLMPVPRINYRQAAMVRAGSDLSGQAEGVEHTSIDLSASSFALSVRNDQMEPDLPLGSVVFVDPEEHPETGDFVLALLDANSDPVLKEYVVDGPLRYLKTRNPRYDTIRMADGMRVIGVVRGVQKELSRRRRRKGDG